MILKSVWGEVGLSLLINQAGEFNRLLVRSGRHLSSSSLRTADNHHDLSLRFYSGGIEDHGERLQKAQGLAEWSLRAAVTLDLI